MKAKAHRTTTFQLSHGLHAELKAMCMFTDKTLGEFIRIAIIEKIRLLKGN